MPCAHSKRGMCQGCTFDSLVAEVARLREEKAQLLVENALLKARYSVRHLIAAEREGENVEGLGLMKLDGKDPR
jgi:hypothetical protein